MPSEHKAVSELATSATATARSARLSVLKNSRRARPSRSRSRSRQFGHGLIMQKQYGYYEATV